jgi:hypothetical protein
MRAALAFILLIVLSACGKSSFTTEDLEGEWESTDTSWAKVRLSFSNEHVRIYHPADLPDQEIVRLIDSTNRASINNLYRYKIDKDTIRYDHELKFRPGAMPTPIRIYMFRFIIHKLENDTLTLEDPSAGMRTDFVRIDPHVQTLP